MTSMNRLGFHKEHVCFWMRRIKENQDCDMLKSEGMGTPDCNRLASQRTDFLSGISVAVTISLV